MSTVEEAYAILKSLGMPLGQHNRVSGLTLVALGRLTPNSTSRLSCVDTVSASRLSYGERFVRAVAVFVLSVGRRQDGKRWPGQKRFNCTRLWSEFDATLEQLLRGEPVRDWGTPRSHAAMGMRYTQRALACNCRTSPDGWLVGTVLHRSRWVRAGPGCLVCLR